MIGRLDAEDIAEIETIVLTLLAHKLREYAELYPENPPLAEVNGVGRFADWLDDEAAAPWKRRNEKHRGEVLQRLAANATDPKAREAFKAALQRRGIMP